MATVGPEGRDRLRCIIFSEEYNLRQAVAYSGSHCVCLRSKKAAGAAEGFVFCDGVGSAVIGTDPCKAVLAQRSDFA
jgi:hypothetical protein